MACVSEGRSQCESHQAVFIAGSVYRVEYKHLLAQDTPGAQSTNHANWQKLPDSKLVKLPDLNGRPPGFKKWMASRLRLYSRTRDATETQPRLVLKGPRIFQTNLERSQHGVRRGTSVRSQSDCSTSVCVSDCHIGVSQTDCGTSVCRRLQHVGVCFRLPRWCVSD